mgnify:CR=1 FL=1
MQAVNSVTDKASMLRMLASSNMSEEQQKTLCATVRSSLYTASRIRV